MGMLDVPRGVELRTGVLTQHINIVAGVSATAGQRHSFDLGPGFAVGILGVNYEMQGIVGGDGNNVAYALSLDPQAPLIVAPLDADRSIVLRGNVETELTTSGLALYRERHLMFPGPLLTVQDATSLVTTVGTATDVVGTLYFAIYEVKDADFLRIAGVSLSRS